MTILSMLSLANILSNLTHGHLLLQFFIGEPTGKNVREYESNNEMVIDWAAV